MFIILLFTDGLKARGVQLAKNDQFGFRFGFAKKLRFLVWFQFYNFFLHLSVNAIFHLCLYGMMLEMTYFDAALVQLISAEVTQN